MANGKIRFGKESGGELGLVIPDGVDNTEVVVPESGELATKQYVDASVKDDQVASEVPVTPTGNLSSNTVQSALEEIQAEADLLNSSKANLAGGNAFTGTQTIDGSGVLTQAELAGAIGNINSPLLDLPLKNSLSMKAGVGSVNFSRATTATYIDRYGVLQYASIDEPRFEKDGLLIEGASTNLLESSNDFSNGLYWSTYDGATVTADTTVSPDGSQNADTINVSATTVARIANLSTVTGSQTYTFSAWFNGAAGDTLTIFFETGGGTFKVETHTFVATGDWERQSVTITTNADNTLLWSGVGGSLSNEVSFSMFGAQLEELPFASSYIPTTDSAVTRSADVCSVDYVGNHPKLTEDYSVVLDADILGASASSQYLYSGGDQGTSERNSILRVDGSQSSVRFYGNGNILKSDNTNIQSRYAVTRTDGANYSVYLDGTLVVIAVASIIDGSLPTNIGIGCKTIGASSMYGHIKNFRIYDKALSATEVALA